MQIKLKIFIICLKLVDKSQVFMYNNSEDNKEKGMIIDENIIY